MPKAILYLVERGHLYALWIVLENTIALFGVPIRASSVLDLPVPILVFRIAVSSFTEINIILFCFADAAIATACGVNAHEHS